MNFTSQKNVVPTIRTRHDYTCPIVGAALGIGAVLVAYGMWHLIAWAVSK